MKIIRAILTFLGPLGVVGVFFACYLLGKIWGCNSLSSDRNLVCLESHIEEIRQTGKLKILRVMEGGIGSYPFAEEDRNVAYVDFMYNGEADYYIDLSTNAEFSCEWNGQTSRKLVVRVSEPKLGPIRESVRNGKAKGVNGFDIQPPYFETYGNREERRKLLDSLNQIKSLMVERDIRSEYNKKMAKRQAERLLRNMFAHFVEDKDRDIEIIWK